MNKPDLREQVRYLGRSLETPKSIAERFNDY